mgnify:CR=1 FL=1
MFLSNDCAVVTSLETTNALSGVGCCDIPSAIWFVPEPATKLNDGAAGACAPPPPPLAPKEDATLSAVLVADVIAPIIPAACAA